MKTIKGDELKFTSANADDITELIAYFITGLKERSKYAVTVYSNIGKSKKNIF